MISAKFSDVQSWSEYNRQQAVDLFYFIRNFQDPPFAKKCRIVKNFGSFLHPYPQSSFPHLRLIKTHRDGIDVTDESIKPYDYQSNTR